MKKIKDKMSNKKIYFYVTLLSSFIFLLPSCGKIINYSKTYIPEKYITKKIKIDLKWIKPIGKKDIIYYYPKEYSQPFITDNYIYVAVSDNNLYCIDKKNGDKIWNYEAFGQIGSSLLYHEGSIYFGDNKGNFYSISSEKGTKKWSYKTNSLILSLPLIVEENVYFLTTSDELFALDKKTGNLIWQNGRDLTSGMTIYSTSSPTYNDGIIYVGFSDGYISAFNAKTGGEIWSKNLTKGEGRFKDIDATPVIDKEWIYIPTYEGYLYALNKKDGSIKWSFNGGGVKAVSIDDNKIYLASLSGKIFTLEKKEGTLIWEYFYKTKKSSIFSDKIELLGGTPTKPSLTEEYIIFGTSDKYLYILDKLTGIPLYRYRTDSGISSEPVVYNNNEIYLLSNGGYLYKFVI